MSMIDYTTYCQFSSSFVPKWVAVSWVSWQPEPDHHWTLSSSLIHSAASARTVASENTGQHYQISASVALLAFALEDPGLLPKENNGARWTVQLYTSV